MIKLQNILSGRVTIDLHLDFLLKRNNADIAILNKIRDTINPRISDLHNSTVVASSFMYAGTATDEFYKKNLDWLARAKNWARFTATASLGVIHKGRIKDSMKVLQPYLPNNSGSTSDPYAEGGSLYALGLIHCNQDVKTEFLVNALKQAANEEFIQHGACLGIGLSAIGTGNEKIYDELKNVLFQDNAVAGEAAAVAIGLVMLGSKHKEAIEEMLAYAQDTDHEKIIRGLSIGIAFTMYEREEEADSLIEQMLLNKDHIIRYGAMYTIGLAYCGTANNGALKKLLHIAVSDVDNDVRRVAVVNIGFLLYNDPEQCPKVVSLLAESYNPYVRYGATLAVAIACAGTGLQTAIDLLMPLTKDSVDYVRQGALMGLAMVLLQFTEAQEPKVKEVRELYEMVIGDRHEPITTKFGAILASGILDAGGRNVTISASKHGHNQMRSIVGLVMFTQYWYWYPYLLFLSLSFDPTVVVGLNHDLKMPKFEFLSNAKKSMFDYPKKKEKEKKKEMGKVVKAVLSTSKKEKKKSSASDATEVTDMDVDEDASASTTKKDSAESDEKPTEEEEGGEEKSAEKEEEENFQILENPARVTKEQVKYLSFNKDERYIPLKLIYQTNEDGGADDESKKVVDLKQKGRASDVAVQSTFASRQSNTNTVHGILIVTDATPDADEQLVDLTDLSKAETEEEEPKPPAPFTWP